MGPISIEEPGGEEGASWLSRAAAAVGAIGSSHMMQTGLRSRDVASAPASGAAVDALASQRVVRETAEHLPELAQEVREDMLLAASSWEWEGLEAKTSNTEGCLLGVAPHATVLGLQ